MKKDSSKFIVDFGFSHATLGHGMKPKSKPSKPLNQWFSKVYTKTFKYTTDINKLNPLLSSISQSGYVCRFITMTIDPYMQFLEDEISMSNILNQCHQKMVDLDMSFVGCLEYNKSGILHNHIIYITKNLHRVRLLKKAITPILSKRKSRFCIKDEPVTLFNNCVKYITKDDKNAAKLDHKKPYIYYGSTLIEKINDKKLQI